MRSPAFNIAELSSVLLWERELQEEFTTDKEKELSERFKDSARRTHFLLGRAAFRIALKQTGSEQAQCSLMRKESGEPLWPTGYCGSISHCEDQHSKEAQAIACAASLANFRSLGVDIEHSQRLFEPKIKNRIGTDLEFKALKDESELMLLSAKEALFKALHPLSQTFFGLLDAELIWNESEKVFHALLKKNLNAEFTASYACTVLCKKEEDFIVSLCAISR